MQASALTLTHAPIFGRSHSGRQHIRLVLYTCIHRNNASPRSWWPLWARIKRAPTWLGEEALEGRGEEAAISALVLKAVPAQGAPCGLQNLRRRQRGPQRAHHVLQRVVRKPCGVRHRHWRPCYPRLHPRQHFLPPPNTTPQAHGGFRHMDWPCFSWQNQGA